jgi:hypothetical protein
VPAHLTPGNHAQGEAVRRAACLAALLPPAGMPCHGVHRAQQHFSRESCEHAADRRGTLPAGTSPRAPDRCARSAALAYGARLRDGLRDVPGPLDELPLVAGGVVHERDVCRAALHRPRVPRHLPACRRAHASPRMFARLQVTDAPCGIDTVMHSVPFIPGTELAALHRPLMLQGGAGASGAHQAARPCQAHRPRARHQPRAVNAQRCRLACTATRHCCCEAMRATWCQNHASQVLQHRRRHSPGPELRLMMRHVLRAPPALLMLSTVL